MLAQVGWNYGEFLQHGFWLALEPPSPEYGLRMPPLHDGGWYIIASITCSDRLLSLHRASI